MENQTDRQTDTQTAVTNIHLASAAPHAKCNDDDDDRKENDVAADSVCIVRPVRRSVRRAGCANRLFSFAPTMSLWSR